MGVVRMLDPSTPPAAIILKLFTVKMMSKGGLYPDYAVFVGVVIYSRK